MAADAGGAPQPFSVAFGPERLHFAFDDNSMRSAHLSFVTWLTGYSGWAFYCALVSTFGLTGYYSDMLRGHVPDWVGVGLLIVPIAVIVFIQWGEAPDRLVAIAHFAAASWFMILALGMEVGHVFGYDPKGSVFYRILAHLGWTFAWAGIYRRSRMSQQKIVDQTLEATAAESGIMTVTDNRTLSASAPPLPGGCASARWE